MRVPKKFIDMCRITEVKTKTGYIWMEIMYRPTGLYISDSMKSEQVMRLRRYLYEELYKLTLKDDGTIEKGKQDA